MSESTTNTALLIMDVQPNILGRLQTKDAYLETIKTLLKGAREHHVPVIFVVVGFRPGLPEVSDRNLSFSALKDRMGADMTNPEPAITPETGEVVVTKRRISAFTGSDLEVVLRARNLNRLILTGISTSGVVLSTIREAADKDYQLTVLSDACADPAPEVHNLLMTKVFPRQATITTTDEWLEKIN
jgi:nicotinamidase-related amidase